MPPSNDTEARLQAYFLLALDQSAGATRDECVGLVRDFALSDPYIETPTARKVDVFLVTQYLRNSERAEPPLAAQLEYLADEVSPTGNVIGSPRFALTQAGSAVLEPPNFPAVSEHAMGIRVRTTIDNGSTAYRLTEVQRFPFRRI